MDRVEVISAAVHSAWYGYVVLGLGEPGQPWETAPEYQKSSWRHAVRFWDELDVFSLAVEKLCAASHLAWMNYLKRQGWKWGPEHSTAKRETPNLMPWDDLPIAQKRKEEVAVRAYLAMRSLMDSPSFTE